MLRPTALVALAATALALTASTSAAPVRLTATVGPGHTIVLKKGALRVKTLKRGIYKIRVSDRSSEHDFHLRGPVSRILSSLGWTGSKTITLILKPGRYSYVCDPHADEMFGAFRVSPKGFSPRRDHQAAPPGQRLLPIASRPPESRRATRRFHPHGSRSVA